MPRYKFAFPVFNATMNDKSFNVADVEFVKKSNLDSNYFLYIDKALNIKENQIFATVTVCGEETYAKKTALEKCCFATDIFKICSDLYHSNIFNPKKWQFDIISDLVTQGLSYVSYKDLTPNSQNKYHINLHTERFNSSIDSRIIESMNKWNIKDFETMYHARFSSNCKSIHKVLQRVCHIYSKSFSINNLFERVILLCTVLDTLATNEREGKIPQLKKYLPSLVLIDKKLSVQLENFIERMYNIRSEYIHNAYEMALTEDDVDKLEKIVYRLILQMTRSSANYNSTKEICCAIDKNIFNPFLDNLPTIVF